MRLSIWVVLLGLWSCQEVSNSNTTSRYYKVDSLISAQQVALYTNNAALEKKAYIGADSAVVTFTPDSVQWQDELNILKKADISNPTLDGIYVSEITDDPNSNLTVRTTSTDKVDAEVKFFKLYYLERVGELRKFEAMWEEKNPLNSSQKIVTLFFEDIHDQVLLKSYKIKGTQKMILQDTVKFEITGTIKY
ncbi:hypothetical protein FNH22_04710 [Fulvivirga sp. M361]|uniref:hypothetical protein n=1 Tax=Fulvivirga sp. M361 TaxID=2594266 RepID=UPI00117B336B|nr:hypothetical protein [Fulvivirga sp. M361]TRX61361.1 hypothetical protein FNH22_04710 [Fulvivirga sp. M361]